MPPRVPLNNVPGPSMERPSDTQQLAAPQSTNKILTSLAERLQRIYPRNRKPKSKRSHSNPPQALDGHRVRESDGKLYDVEGYLSDRHGISASVSQISQQAVTSTLQGAHDFNIGGSPHFVNIGVGKQVHNYGGTHGLDNLKEFVSFNALHDSSAQDPERLCHPGTREKVLKHMRAWVDDPDTPRRIFWLHGPAGVGKSAIAQTISQSYDEKKIAATFFFFRSDSTRNDGNRLFPTLAWQLAISIPDAKPYIIHCLNQNPDIARKTIEIQFEKLISGPFSSMTEIASQAQALAPVVVIDGIDECPDTKLQQRILVVLGKAVADSRISLRFLISCRPEANIKEALDHFRRTTLQIDLAKIDGANSDVKNYLKAEFVRIASTQEIDPETWPGESVIDEFVLKSSGQFIYASTIIKFVGDDFNSAISQLDILLGLKPHDGESPFADLDALYIEILQRQPGQNFLKEFLTLLVARSGHAGFSGTDDALLLNMDKRELQRKLRGMHSLLKFEPSIDAHHRSFLDFLEDPSRSCQYHNNKQNAERQYLKLITDALVRYATSVIKNPNYHGAGHFAPGFREGMKRFPRNLNVSFDDWEEILQPLHGLQEEMLAVPNTKSHWEHGFCSDCTVFYIIDDLLMHLMLFRSAMRPPSTARRVTTLVQSPSSLSDMKGTLGANDYHHDSNLKYLDGDMQWNVDLEGEVDLSERLMPECLSSLLSELRSKEPLSAVTFDIMFAILRFDHAETASRLRRVSDCQILVDFIYHLIQKKHSLGSCNQVVHDALFLALEIHARISLLPSSLFLNWADVEFDDDQGSSGKYKGKPVEILRYVGFQIREMYQGAFMWANLSHENILPLLGVFEDTLHPGFSFVVPYQENRSLYEWRERCNPSTAEIERLLLEVAKVNQYVQSLGIVLDPVYTSFIFVDSNFHVQVTGVGLCSGYLSSRPLKHLFRAHNVRAFGILLYEIYFNRKFDSPERPEEPEIHDDGWQLIQRCCADEPESRPTIDEVVREMESWRSHI